MGWYDYRAAGPKLEGWTVRRASHRISREVRLLQRKIEFEFELDFRESTRTRATRATMILGSDKVAGTSEMFSIP
jgi:hypothetical protein